MNSAVATDAGGPGVLFSDWDQWLRTELAPTPGRLGQMSAGRQPRSAVSPQLAMPSSQIRLRNLSTSAFL